MAKEKEKSNQLIQRGGVGPCVESEGKREDEKHNGVNKEDLP
jgi:hypothetical protein